MNTVQPTTRIVSGFLLLCLVGCTSSPVRPPVVSPPATQIRNAASFSCLDPQSGLQETICQSDELATLDREMADGLHREYRSLDVLGRLYLMHDQRRWLLNRIAQCQVPMERGRAASAESIDCLSALYRKRIAELAATRTPLPMPVKSGAHALAAYVEFRLSDNRDPALCSRFESLFNEAIATQGEVNPALMKGFVELAGSHGSATYVQGNRRLEVLLYDAGPYAGFQIRAKGIEADGRILLHDQSLPEWIRTLPNSGGSFSNISSQTSDYGAIDVFQTEGRELALVSETWGYYAAAARGEYPHAGLYEIGAGPTLQPKCLYRTYLTPPSRGAFDKLPSFKALTDMLNTMAGSSPEALAPDERRDEELLRQESLWTLFNMPLVAIEEHARFGRKTKSRFHHDQALERVFAWSERNVQSKLLYRRLLPMMGPAYDDLVRTYQETQGLKRQEATAAADLVIMAIFQSASENLGQQELPVSPREIEAAYVPRYGVIPVLGELENGRRFGDLHGVVLNRAPANLVEEFLKQSLTLPTETRGRGPGGDTALMAAVRDAATLSQLLDAGFDPNGLNDWHKTPLMSAAEMNQFTTAEMLLKAGANVRLATIARHLEGAGGVDEEDAKVSARTALMYAAGSAGEALVQLLLGHGASKKDSDGKGASACEYLVLNKFINESERSRLKDELCR